jgi:hypothetical protein
MIIAIDERSKTSPITILDRYKHKIFFELWNDSHYFTIPDPALNLQEINEARQQTFLAKCIQTFKQRGHGWTLFTDTDEFVKINKRALNQEHFLHRPFVPSIRERSSIYKFVQHEQNTQRTICFSMGRLQFAPDESALESVDSNIPAYLNASDFLTLRWLMAAGELPGPKNILDLRQVPESLIPTKMSHQHRVIYELCGESGNTWNRKNSLLQVYHYFGTSEQFHFREDARAKIAKFNKRGRNTRMERYRGLRIEDVDDVRPWLLGFIETVGGDEVERLLQGIGRTQGWPPASAHASRFVHPARLKEWVVPSRSGGNAMAVLPEAPVPPDRDDTDDDQIQSDEEQSVDGPIFYSRARPDRSGAALADMLLADAYAFAHGKTYGGACGEEHKQYQAETENLILTLGLHDRIKFQCPDDSEKVSVVDRRVYFAENSRLWSRNYLATLFDIIHYPKTKYEVVVHVRRGDVSPCGKYANRYLPNSHYLNILDTDIPKNLSVAIFSESYAYETFDEFEERGFAVLLDTDLAEVWKAMMSAKYIILSKSSFSFVPAMLNPTAQVIYTPFMVNKLAHWHDVRPEIIKRTTRKLKELAAACDKAEQR